MTQKELLYVEDAIGHETNIIGIVTDTINSLEDEDLKEFMEQKLNDHIAYKNELMKFLEDNANE